MVRTIFEDMLTNFLLRDDSLTVRENVFDLVIGVGGEPAAKILLTGAVGQVGVEETLESIGHFG